MRQPGAVRYYLVRPSIKSARCNVPWSSYEPTRRSAALLGCLLSQPSPVQRYLAGFGADRAQRRVPWVFFLPAKRSDVVLRRGSGKPNAVKRHLVVLGARQAQSSGIWLSLEPASCSEVGYLWNHPGAAQAKRAEPVLRCARSQRNAVKWRLAVRTAGGAQSSGAWLFFGPAMHGAVLLGCPWGKQSAVKRYLLVLGTVKRCSIVLPAIHAQRVSASLSFQPNERSALLFGRPSSKPSAVRFILLLLELTKQSAILLVVPRSGSLFVRGRYADLSTSLLWCWCRRLSLLRPFLLFVDVLV